MRVNEFKKMQSGKVVYVARKGYFAKCRVSFIGDMGSGELGEVELTTSAYATHDIYSSPAHTSKPEMFFCRDVYVKKADALNRAAGKKYLTK